MKKFAETVIKNEGGFFAVHKNGKTTYEIQGLKSSPLIIFGDWVSPEYHQAEIGKIELQNLKYREEIARMQKTLRKKNKAIKELNGAVKKIKLDRDEWKTEANQLDKEKDGLITETEKLKSQLEKQQPEIPEVPPFVGDWLKGESLEELIDTWYNHTADLPEDVKDYLDSLGEDITTSKYCYKEIVHLIARAKLDGYTVAKEKKYLLKHKSLVIYDGEGKESDVDELYLNAEGNFTIYSYNAKIFTQSEIDRMSTDSYELIEVEK